MGFKPLVIGINGPAGIGKGWLAGKLSQLIPLRSHILSFKEPIGSESMRRMNWRGDYGEFKETLFDNGLTGREVMFEVGAEKRAIDINHYSRQLTENPKFTDAPVIIIDDMGFFHEQDWLDRYSKRLMTIVMAPTKYSVGSIFEGDTRVCLPQRDGFRTIDSNTALKKFKDRLAHVPSDESIDNAQGAVWFSYLLGRSVEQRESLVTL